MQEKQLALVTYEQAKKLKELGFDWECTAFYDLNENNELDYFANQVDWNNEVDTLSAPTVALALKWSREVMGIQYTIEFIEGSGQYECYVYKEFTFIKHNGNLGISKNAYEAAESALLDTLLEHCEQELKNEKD